MVVLVAALAWCAAALVLSCSSSSSGGTEADVTPYTPDAGTPEEVSVPLDLAINDDVPVYPVLVLSLRSVLVPMSCAAAGRSASQLWLVFRP